MDPSKYYQEQTNVVFVGGLSINVTETILKSYMMTFGDLEYLEIKSRDGVSRGFGKVVFVKLADAVAVVEQEHYLNDKRFTCCFYVDSDIARERLEDEKKRKIFVNGISRKTTDDGLRKFFSYFGPVERASINRHKDNSSKGTAFVLFESEKLANYLLSKKKYKEHKLDGSWITIYQCLSKNDITRHAENRSPTGMCAPFAQFPVPARKPRKCTYKEEKPLSTSSGSDEIKKEGSKLRNSSEPFDLIHKPLSSQLPVAGRILNTRSEKARKEISKGVKHEVQAQETQKLASGPSGSELETSRPGSENAFPTASGNYRFNIEMIKPDTPEQMRFLRWETRQSALQQA